ncbi:septum formation family protein [Actinomadura sp.]|uniref:septum formation family protein n=1 Tax=Actinomadura sp. TaxID=1989 RepID=UPI0037C8B2B3
MTASETPPGDAPEPGRRRTNRLAIASLVTGLLGLVLFAVGFAVAALVQTRRRGEKGRGLAAAGIAASAAWITAIAVVVVAGVPRGGDDPGLASDYGQPRASALKPGTCFVGFEEKSVAVFLRAAPCKGAHEGEIAGRAALPERPFPGDGEVAAEAGKLCRDRTAFLEKTGRAEEFRLYTDRPDKEMWERGDRTVTCVVRFIGSGYLTVALEDVAKEPRDYNDLVPGDCVKEWDATGAVSVVDCTEPHKIQVFAVFDLKGDTLPSTAEMDDRAARGCAARARKIWGSRPLPENVEPSYARPNPTAWELDERQVVCMFEAVRGSLTRSLMPE